MKIQVIGSGTSQIGFLYKLSQNRRKLDKNVTIDVFEKGNSFTDRTSKEIMNGFGGQGTFSDGKLSLSDSIGGEVSSYIGKQCFDSLMQDSVNLWTFGFSRDKFEQTDLNNNTENISKVFNLKNKFKQNKMDLNISNFIHLGTDNLQTITKLIYETLLDTNFIKFHFNYEVAEIEKKDTKYILYTKKDSEILKYDDYDIVIIQVGRSGSIFNNNLLKKFNINFKSNVVDIGVRFEMPSILSKNITDLLYEFKVNYISDRDDRVRTFCVNPNGYVVIEDNKDLYLVNGHSYQNKKSEVTNFAILVTHTFTEPFKDSYEYAQSIQKLQNKLQGDGKVLVQRYKDFINLRRSSSSKLEKSFFERTLKEATAGDLNLVLPRRTQKNIEEFIEKLSCVIQGVNNPDNLLYGVEQKFYSVKPNFDTNIRERFKLPNTNIHIIGDQSGYSRGIIQQTISGMQLQEDLLMKM